MKRSFIREILEAIDEQTISFAGGLPDESLFPVDDLAEATRQIVTNPKHFQYTVSNGIRPLREKIADLYNAEGFETKAENILITTGSQQALYIIAKYFAGRTITIEKPSYLGAVNIFKMNNLRMESVALEYDGIDIDGFRDSFGGTGLAYLIPDFQNPKGSLYSVEKRESIAAIVKKCCGYIIEDAPYSELYFGSKAPSISRSIPDQSLHLGSFSKTLSPSLRIGWVRANEKMIARLTMIKETIDLHSSGITQHILNAYLEDGARYRDHLEKLRHAYRDKMEYFAAQLRRIIPEFEFEEPKGGMFIYGRLPGADTKELVYRALEQKVVYVPGSEFHLGDGVCNEIRFNYTHSSKENITEGLERLRGIL